MLFGFPLKHYVGVTRVRSNCDKTTSQSQSKREKSVIFIAIRTALKSLDLSWVEKSSSLTLSEDDSTNVIERQGSELLQSNLSEGWALHRGTQREYSSKPLKHRIVKLF